MQYCDEILIPGSCWTDTRWWTIAIGGSCSLVKNDGRHKDVSETVSLPTVMSFRLRDCEIASSSGSWAWWHDAGIREAANNLDLLLTTGGWWWRPRGGVKLNMGGACGVYLNVGCHICSEIDSNTNEHSLLENRPGFVSLFGFTLHWPLTTSCFNWPAEGSPGLFQAVLWLLEWGVEDDMVTVTTCS